MPKRTGKKFLSIILCVVLTVSCVSFAFAEEAPAAPAVQQAETADQPKAETPTASPSPAPAQAAVTSEPAKEADPTKAPSTEETAKAEETTKPEESAAPTDSAKPEASATPAASASATPAASATPTVSPSPTASASPTPSATPVAEVKELTASVAADTGAKLSAFAGDALTFTAHYEGGKEPVVAQLTLSQDGNIILSDYKETTTVTATVGTYVMTLTVTDADGVSVTASRTVVVSSYTRDAESIEQIDATVKQVKLTGDYAADIVAIAESQLGYQASSANFIIGLDGKQHGYSRYGAWYDWKHNGDNNAEYLLYGEWCASFVSFCGTQAGIPTNVLPHDTGAQQLLKKLGSRFVKAKDHTPKPGELVFFEFEGNDKLADHVGIVSAVTESGITTIEGNKAAAVARGSYALNDKRILGYASITETPWVDMTPTGKDITVEDTADVVPQETPNPEVTPDQPSDDTAITGKTNTNAVNLRSKTSTDSIVVANVVQGTEVTVLSQLEVGGKEWYRIEYEGKGAFVLSNLIDIDGGRAVPVEGEETPSEQPSAEPAQPAEPTTEPAGSEDEPIVVTPTEVPSAEPSDEPTEEPAADPTPAVIDPVTDVITDPTAEPTDAVPTEEPSAEPAADSTEEPAQEPSAEPTDEPAEEPTEAPSESPAAEPTEEPTQEPASDMTEKEQEQVIEQNMRELITLSADVTLYGEFGNEDTAAGTLAAGENVAVSASETQTDTFETETAVATYTYATVYATETVDNATVYFANPNLDAIAEVAASATDAAALLDALSGYVTESKLEEKASEPEQPVEPEATVWAGKYTVTVPAETALYAALSPITEENAEADPFETGYAGENQTGTLAAGETVTADAAQTRVATFMTTAEDGYICEYVTWYTRQNESGETEYFANSSLETIYGILNSDMESAAKVEALRPYCLSVKEPAEVEADVKQAADAADASTDNENAVNLDDITVDVTISPAEAEIGETVTLSANITSPNGLDGVKMQWQYCVLKIVDGIASADWHDAENATEATYTFVMTEETRP